MTLIPPLSPLRITVLETIKKKKLIWSVCLHPRDSRRGVLILWCLYGWGQSLPHSALPTSSHLFISRKISLDPLSSPWPSWLLSCEHYLVYPSLSQNVIPRNGCSASDRKGNCLFFILEWSFSDVADYNAPVWSLQKPRTLSPMFLSSRLGAGPRNLCFFKFPRTPD